MPAPQALFSVNTFREMTTVRVGGKIGVGKLGPALGRGRLMVVDSVLREWHATPPTWPQTLARVTLDVVTACHQWLEPHEGGVKKTRTGAARMPAIQALVDQCYAWLRYLSVLNRKGNVTPATSMASLGRGYANERVEYKGAKTAGQKINPTSGSFLHFETSSMGLSNYDDLSAIEDLVGNPETGKKGKGFENLTVQDFDRLMKFFTPGNPNRGKVLYMNGKDREDYVALVIGGELHAGNERVKIKGPGWLYAMDKYGSLFMVSKSRLENLPPEYGYINHSTMNAGKDVVCAGEIGEYNSFESKNNPELYGKLCISNRSGHYTPSKDNLKAAVVSLKDRGMNITDLVCLDLQSNTAQLGPRFVT